MDLLLDASRRRNWQAKMTALRVPVWWCAACIPAVRYAHTLYARRRRITAAFSGVKSVFTRDGKRARLKMKWDVVGTRVECSALCFFLLQLGRSLVQDGVANPRRREKRSRGRPEAFFPEFHGKKQSCFLPLLDKSGPGGKEHTHARRHIHARTHASRAAPLRRFPPPPPPSRCHWKILTFCLFSINTLMRRKETEKTRKQSVREKGSVPPSDFCFISTSSRWKQREDEGRRSQREQEQVLSRLMLTVNRPRPPPSPNSAPSCNHVISSFVFPHLVVPAKHGWPDSHFLFNRKSPSSPTLIHLLWMRPGEAVIMWPKGQMDPRRACMFSSDASRPGDRKWGHVPFPALLRLSRCPWCWNKQKKKIPDRMTFLRAFFP